MMDMNLGPWGFAGETAAHDAHLTAAAEMESLGFTALWMAGGQLDRLERLTDLLRATQHVLVASYIISADVYQSRAVLDLYQTAEASSPGW